MRSPARVTLCRASDCSALRRTVSISVRLSPRCGTRRSTFAPRSPVSHSWTLSGSVGQHGDEDLARDGVGGAVGLVAVDLLEEVADELRQVLALLLDHPAALAADAAAAHVEDLDGGLELVVGEREHVGVGGVAEDDGVLLQRLLERADVVAQPGRLLELELVRGLLHPPLEALDELGRCCRP